MKNEEFRLKIKNFRYRSIEYCLTMTINCIKYYHSEMRISCRSSPGKREVYRAM